MADPPSQSTQPATHHDAARHQGLDALRFALFLLILYSHTVIELPIVALNGIEMHLLQIAWSGVQGFFALSGFIITTLLMREFERAGAIDIAAFYRRRALKILPPLFAMVATVVLLIQTGALSDKGAWNALPAPGSEAAFATWRGLPWMLGLIGNIPYALGLISLTPALLIVWTLCVEEQFYLAHPWILRAAGEKLTSDKGLIVIALLVAVVFAARQIASLLMWRAGAEPATMWRVIYTLTPFQLDSLLCGVGVAVLTERRHLAERIFSRRWRPRALLAILVATPLAFIPAWRGRAWWAEPILLGLVNLWFALLIFVVARHEPRLRTRPTVRRIAALGRNGYCLYLVHHIALLTAFATMAALPFALSPRVHFWARLALALVLALIFAEMLYRLAEKPFRRFRPGRTGSSASSRAHRSAE